MQLSTTSNKCIVFDYIHKDDYIRAIVQNILDVDGFKVVKSEYSIWYHIPTKTHYCTCVGNLMGKKECQHLKTFFKDERILDIIGEENDK